jgi:hypothetical protein
MKRGHCGRPTTRLAAVLATTLFGSAVALAAQAIIVENWPDYIPCDVLKKYPDGTYEITVPFTRFYTTHTQVRSTRIREAIEIASVFPYLGRCHPRQFCLVWSAESL